MKGILLSIHPQWAAMIYARVKRYELRKNEPRDREFLRQLVKPIYICETGTGLVTGMCSFEAATVCMKASDAAFWSAATPEKVIRYGPGRDGRFHLWRLSDAGRFCTPAPISMFGFTRAPQSWCYVEVGEGAAPFERGERD